MQVSISICADSATCQKTLRYSTSHRTLPPDSYQSCYEDNLVVVYGLSAGCSLSHGFQPKGDPLVLANHRHSLSLCRERQDVKRELRRSQEFVGNPSTDFFCGGTQLPSFGLRIDMKKRLQFRVLRYPSPLLQPIRAFLLLQATRFRHTNS